MRVGVVSLTRVLSLFINKQIIEGEKGEENINQESRVKTGHSH